MKQKIFRSDPYLSLFYTFSFSVHNSIALNTIWCLKASPPLQSIMAKKNHPSLFAYLIHLSNNKSKYVCDARCARNKSRPSRSTQILCLVTLLSDFGIPYLDVIRARGSNQDGYIAWSLNIAKIAHLTK